MSVQSDSPLQEAKTENSQLQEHKIIESKEKCRNEYEDIKDESEPLQERENNGREFQESEAKLVPEQREEGTEQPIEEEKKEDQPHGDEEKEGTEEQKLSKEKMNPPRKKRRRGLLKDLGLDEPSHR